MTGSNKKYDKEALKEFFCSVIEALDDGEYTVNGTFGWCCMELDIQKVEE